MVTVAQFSTLTAYVAASYRHLHLVRLWQASLKAMVPTIQILDWTGKAVPLVPGCPSSALPGRWKRQGSCLTAL